MSVAHLLTPVFDYHLTSGSELILPPGKVNFCFEHDQTRTEAREGIQPIQAKIDDEKVHLPLSI